MAERYYRGSGGSGGRGGGYRGGRRGRGERGAGGDRGGGRRGQWGAARSTNEEDYYMNARPRHRNRYQVDPDEELLEDRDRERDGGGGAWGGGGGGGWQRGGRGGGRGKHPPGLKGREIGLWYARQNQDKPKREEQPHGVHMDEKKERHIANLLASIRAGEECPEQPSQSFRDPDSDDNTDRNSYPGASNTDRSENSKRSTYSDFKALNQMDRGYENERLGKFVKDAWDDNDDDDDDMDTSKPLYHKKNSNSSESKPSLDFISLTSSNENPTKTKFEDDDVIIESESDLDDNDDNDVKAVTLDESVIIVEQEKVLIDLTEEEQEDVDEADVINLDLEDYQQEAEDRSFLFEFRAHNAANRQSTENVGAVPEKISTTSIKRDERLDTTLQEDLQHKVDSNQQYQKMIKFRHKLPSYRMREEIVSLVRDNQVVVLSGETGCGKTTQVPQFILDDYIARGEGSMCRIICTQPRRISAISVAERVAEERGERCGENSVGYQIRLEHKLCRQQGSILYCTTGILLQFLASDPVLGRTSHVILDEIHERDILSDFLMIILKDLLPRRPDLKVILMSATLNADMFSKYFFDSPRLNIPGYTFPVKEYLLEEVIEMTGYGRHGDAPPVKRPRYGGNFRDERERQRCYTEWVDTVASRRKNLSRSTLEVLKTVTEDDIDVNLVCRVVEYICQTKPCDGAILVFLPGWDQIKKVNDAITQLPMYRAAPSRFRVIPLHSLLPTVNQREVFNRPPEGVRKIIVATNIAETSITIDDVVYVVDCGRIKMKNFDAEHGIATLKPEWVSRANAKQRRGRAGRVQPGECYHLYTEFHEAEFADYQQPEMLRTRLEELCLQIKLLKLGRVIPFVNKAMQTPSIEALRHALNTLTKLNALDEYEDLTPLGYHLAKMPVDPHTGKMLLFAAMFGCLDPILTIAASLSFKDAFYMPMGKEKIADERRRMLAQGSRSDHIMLANAYKGWERAKSRGTDRHYCSDNFLSPSTLKMLRDMRGQFCRLLNDTGFIETARPENTRANINSKNEKLVKAVICAGLYPNVARHVGKRNPRKPPKLITNTEGNLAFHPKSVNEKEREFTSPWFVYHLKMKTAKVYLYDSTQILAYPLLFFGGDIMIKQDGGMTMDEWISFHGSEKVGKLIQELRGEMDKLLEYKITHPGPTCWEKESKEGAVMSAIVDLIMSEEEKVIRSVEKRDGQERRRGRDEGYWGRGGARGGGGRGGGGRR